MTNPINVVAFDCDGVMFDTTVANKAYYNRILKHFNHAPITPEQFYYVQMHTVENSILHLFGDEASLLNEVNTYRKEMSYFPLIKQMIIEPHLKPLLSQLRPAFKTAVATNRTDTMASVISEHGLEDYFDLVVCASDVERPKPHPDLLDRVAGYFDCPPRQIVYIGDSKLDELAARAAGVVFMAYNNPDLDSRYHLKSLAEVAPLLMTQA